MVVEGELEEHLVQKFPKMVIADLILTRDKYGAKVSKSVSQ